MDIKLHYSEKGSGEPLVLLHGNGESGAYFKHQIDCFSDRFRVIAVDTRGQGESPRGSAPLTIAQFAEDLNDFLAGLKIEKANILGFSDGGNTALVFAMKYPEKVSRLVLNGANLCPAGLKCGIRFRTVLAYKTANKTAFKNQKAKFKTELLSLMLNEPNIDAKELLKVGAKTLVIAGTRDMIKQKHTETIYRNIPDARLVVIRGNHFIAAKNPLVFNRYVGLFLRDEL